MLVGFQSLGTSNLLPFRQSGDFAGHFSAAGLSILHGVATLICAVCDCPRKYAAEEIFDSKVPLVGEFLGQGFQIALAVTRCKGTQRDLRYRIIFDSIIPDVLIALDRRGLDVEFIPRRLSQAPRESRKITVLDELAQCEHAFYGGVLSIARGQEARDLFLEEFTQVFNISRCTPEGILCIGCERYGSPHPPYYAAVLAILPKPQDPIQTFAHDLPVLKPRPHGPSAP